MVAQSPKGPKTNLSFYVDQEIVDKIDNYRGEIPRSRIMQRAINQFLERELSIAASAVAALGERRNNKEK
jgi:predicted transcriptional regulator